MERELAKRVAWRYEKTGTRFYVIGKLSSDPICGQVVTLAHALGSLGEVVDVGCGRGQMGLLLVTEGWATSANGYDWDEEKVREANAAAGGDERLRYWVGDTREEPIPSCDTVLMLDVLHYLTHDEQSALVLRAAKAARRAIVIRELDPDRGWRSAMTRLQERVTTGLRYNVGARVLVRRIEPVVACLEGEGFSVSVEPSWGSTPFSNVAIIAKKA